MGYVVGSRDHAAHDTLWLRERATAAGIDLDVESGCVIRDLSNEVCVLHVCGPKTLSFLGAVENRLVAGDGTGALPFMHAVKLRNFGGCEGLDATVFRVSFSGLPGYELHVAASDGPRCHDVLWSHPAKELTSAIHFGSAALNSMRVEQGFKVRADLDLAHYREGGIDPFVSKKRASVGRDDGFTATKRSCLYEITTSPGWEWSVPGDCPVIRTRDGAVVGYTTSSAPGAQTRKTIALGYLSLEQTAQMEAHTEADTALVVQAFGHDWPARLLEDTPVMFQGRLD